MSSISIQRSGASKSLNAIDVVAGGVIDMAWAWPFGGGEYRRQLDLVLAATRDLESATLPEIFGRTATRIRDYYQASFACMHPTQDSQLFTAETMVQAFPLCPVAHGPVEEFGANLQLEAGFYQHACEQHHPVRLTDYKGNHQWEAFMRKLSVREAHAIPLLYQGEAFAAVLVYFDGSKRLTPLDNEFLTTLGNLVGAAMQRELKRLAQDEYEDVIQALSQVIEAKDGYTSQHVARVTDYAVRLAQAAGLAGMDLRRLRKAAALHDIGKVGVPDHVLGKPGPLDDQEWMLMKRHPVTGDEIVRRLHSPDANEMAQVVRHHHERLDGKGYPDGLCGDSIPLTARIVAIGDAFDAMTSDRPYRRGMPADRAVEILKAGAGTQWDAHLVELFVASVIPELNLA